MFIELTDHLRCPADHEESFVVLLPEAMDGRSVLEGQIGCPVCGRTSHLVAGEWSFGAAPGHSSAAMELDAAGLVALVGIGGPGGYIVLVGGAAVGAAALADAEPGIGIVAVNPPPSVVDAPRVSVLRGERIPLKTNSMRGVVLGAGYGGDAGWIEEAARVTLPGLRVVGEGSAPPETIELMASAKGVWVGTKRRK